MKNAANILMGEEVIESALETLRNNKKNIEEKIAEMEKSNLPDEDKDDYLMLMIGKPANVDCWIKQYEKRKIREEKYKKSRI